MHREEAVFGFGGGPRKCPGEVNIHTYMFVFVVMSELLRRQPPLYLAKGCLWHIPAHTF